MYQIKLRVWDKTKERWSTMEELLSEIPVSTTVGAPSVLSCGGENYEIQLFVGLLDKNGGEIYAGDIVDLQNHPFEGPIKINGVYEVGYNERMELCCGSLLLHRVLPYIAVIGNVHDNPEFLMTT